MTYWIIESHNNKLATNIFIDTENKVYKTTDKVESDSNIDVTYICKIKCVDFQEEKGHNNKGVLTEVYDVTNLSNIVEIKSTHKRLKCINDIRQAYKEQNTDYLVRKEFSQENYKDKLIYATDLDRTLIYSERFLNEHTENKEKAVVCESDILKGKIISYMSSEVRKELISLNKRDDVAFVPVTTRSYREFNRINLGFKPKFAIIDCGGTILYRGKPLQEYEEYIKDNVDICDILSLKIELEQLSTLSREVAYVDNKFLFTKTDKPDDFDAEANFLQEVFPKIEIIRQGSKVYCVPRAFTKGIALRWLQNKLKNDKILATGDSILDISMLAIANYAVLPSHASLLQEEYVKTTRISEGGIDSPLATIELAYRVLEGKE